MYRTWHSFILLALLLANSATAQDKVPPLSEQSIYIPYDKLEETFEKQGRGVFLPYERFQELWKAAQEKQPQPADVTPPVKAMITEIESLAQVEQDVMPPWDSRKPRIRRGWDSSVSGSTRPGQVAAIGTTLTPVVSVLPSPQLRRRLGRAIVPSSITLQKSAVAVRPSLA